jgi:hypothetical protein
MSEDDVIDRRRLCRICGLLRAIHCLGVCKTCYERSKPKGVGKVSDREMAVVFEVLEGSTEKDIPLPREPTQFLPGTEKKIRVMRERASRNESIFHPDDASLVSRREEDWGIPDISPDDVGVPSIRKPRARGVRGSIRGLDKLGDMLDDEDGFGDLYEDFIEGGSWD